MTNPKEPFKLIEGDDMQTALHNRVLAIDRIHHLSGVDLRKKSVYYRHALDLEMYERWYKKQPKDHKIDEEWIQRAVEVIKGMEEDEIKHKKSSEMASQVFKSHIVESALANKKDVYKYHCTKHGWDSNLRTCWECQKYNTLVNRVKRWFKERIKK